MKNYDDRKIIVLAIFLVIAVIFLVRLFYLQVIDESYKLSAQNQAVRIVTQYPVRGLVYDRKGQLMVYNEAAYDLMVVPREVTEIDTLDFCSLVGISIEDFRQRFEKARSYSRYKASVFEKQIPAYAYAKIAEKLFKFPGFYTQQRTLRKYPRSVAAHLLGYIAEVDPSDIDRDQYYRSGDYIGKAGLEKEYEKELRGVRGSKRILVDVHNVVKGNFQDGQYDTLAVPGTNLISTIDLDLQEYGELLMQNKRGSVVAIEPKTGEILAMLSAPTYDPNLLVGRDRNVNYRELAANDSLNPLFNRALYARYRPGSIFKLVQSLTALHLGIITPGTHFACTRSIINCHGSHTNDDLPNAIIHSCNPYFWNVYKRMIQQGKSTNMFKDAALGLKEWRDVVLRFGFGEKLETDFPNLVSGSIPGNKLYNKWYGEGRWAFSTIYSNSIGEGELGVVPLEMANLSAIIANRGYYYTPHFIKQIGDSAMRPEFTVKHETEIDTSYFGVVIQAMEKVIGMDGGTARRARIEGITVCGKTGTVQNPGDRPDHSVFIAFAPKDDPKIAIAVYVEYSDFGGTWAAPISSLMIEKYLTGEIKDKEKEQRILDAKFLTIY